MSKTVEHEDLQLVFSDEAALQAVSEVARRLSGDAGNGLLSVLVRRGEAATEMQLKLYQVSGEELGTAAILVLRLLEASLRRCGCGEDHATQADQVAVMLAGLVRMHGLPTQLPGAARLH